MTNERSAPTPRTPASAPTLRPLERLREFTIGAKDGDVGTFDDVYFDDQSWTIRYLVVSTGGWLSGRRVLISPPAVEAIDAAGRRLVTGLSKEQVKNSPDIDTTRPVSRQHEMRLFDYYGYPYYWTGPYRWGAAPYPYAAPYPSAAPYPPGTLREADRPAVAEELAARDREQQDPHLRSAREVTGYAIEAADGRLGHVEDFLVDDDEWAIRYLIVDPKSWWPGPHVLIATDWITRVSWSDAAVHVNVSREAVQNAPRYDNGALLDREQELRLHRSYGRQGYWERHPEVWMYPPAA